jgi:hypothetical protein
MTLELRYTYVYTHALIDWLIKWRWQCFADSSATSSNTMVLSIDCCLHADDDGSSMGRGNRRMVVDYLPLPSCTCFQLQFLDFLSPESSFLCLKATAIHLCNWVTRHGSFSVCPFQGYVYHPISRYSSTAMKKSENQRSVCVSFCSPTSLSKCHILLIKSFSFGTSQGNCPAP